MIHILNRHVHNSFALTVGYVEKLLFDEIFESKNRIVVHVQLERLKDGNIHMCFFFRSGYITLVENTGNVVSAALRVVGNGK